MEVDYSTLQIPGSWYCATRPDLANGLRKQLYNVHRMNYTKELPFITCLTKLNGIAYPSEADNFWPNI